MNVLLDYLSDERLARKRDEVARLTNQHASARADAEGLMEVMRGLDDLLRSAELDARTSIALERVRIREDLQRAIGKAEKLLRERDDAQERLALWVRIRRAL